MFELGSLLHSSVGGKFLAHSMAEDVLVAEHVSNSALINWHTFLVSVLHSLLVKLVTILHAEVLLLRNLSESLKLSLVSEAVHEILVDFLAGGTSITSSVLDHVDECALVLTAEG